MNVFQGRLSQSGILREFRKAGGFSIPVFKSFSFRITGFALVFLLQVLLARLMGPAHFGHYTVIITTLNIFLVLSLFGLDSAAEKFLPAYIDKKDYRSARSFVRFSFRMITVLSIICSITVFIILLAKSKGFKISFSEGLFWGVLMIPFLACMYQASAILRALNRYRGSLLPVYFLFPTLIGAGCMLYYATYDKLSVDAVMLISLGSAFVTCIYASRYAKAVLNREAPDGEGDYRPRKWLAASSVIFIAFAFETLLRHSDILLVSYYLNNTQAGYYAVAVRLSMLAALGLTVVSQIFTPKISHFFEVGQLVKMQQVVRNSSMQVLSISLPAIFLLTVGGKWILGLFGEEFRSAYLPLMILLFGQFIYTATGLAGGLMKIAGYKWTIFVFYLLTFLLQLLLNTVLIPAYGITGAAISSSISLIVLSLIMYSFIKSRIKIKASAL